MARWTPSLVPSRDDDDQNVYLVVVPKGRDGRSAHRDDFGRNGRAYREADVEGTDLETVIADLLSGEYKNPVKIVAFNTVRRPGGCGNGAMAEPLRHRQTKEAETDMSYLTPPRHISTLPERTSRAGAEREPWDHIGHPLEKRTPPAVTSAAATPKWGLRTSL